MEDEIFNALAKLARKNKRAERDAGWRPEPIKPGDRVVRVMEPGAWYAVSDLRHLAGLPETTQFRMFSHGYLTRRANREYRPRMSRSEKGSQPKWLYTLTTAGKARRRLLRLLT
jgi:hypothetical protein